MRQPSLSALKKLPPPKVLKPGGQYQVHGILESTLGESLEYSGKDINNIKEPAIEYSLFVRYKDKFTPEKQVAKSNTIKFRVKPRAMKIGSSIYFVGNTLRPIGEKESTMVWSYGSRYQLMAEEKGDLFYVMAGFGLTRLGKFTTLNEVCLLRDVEGNIQAAWRINETTFGYAYFRRGFPNQTDIITLNGNRTKYLEWVKRNIKGRVKIAKKGNDGDGPAQEKVTGQ